jgi:hypothetical protein
MMLLGETCITNEHKDYREFHRWADSKYFRLRGSTGHTFENAFGFKSGSIWSPTEDIANIFVAKEYMTDRCKVSGNIEDPHQLYEEVYTLVNEKGNLFKGFWDKTDLNIDPGELIKTDHGNMRRFVIYSADSLRVHQITVETYYNFGSANFTLSHAGKEVR